MKERARESRRAADLLVPCALLALAALSACGKPMWRSPLPTLSDQPLGPHEPVEAGIYPLLLPDETAYPLLIAESTVVIVPGRDDPPAPHPDDTYLIARRWPDSVKAGFAAAFADYGKRGREPHPVSRLALLNPQVQFGKPHMMECVDEGTPKCVRSGTWVWLSPLGFNTDSTYSVGYMRTWCGGGLCGTGTVFLFRRQPGKQWTLWSERRLWIS
jgi:hypothetical protein